MIKSLTKSFVFILVSLCMHQLLAQQKIEREYRSDENKIPAKAVAFINALSLKSNVKWYIEKGTNRTSIETKFKINGQEHSVEFDSIGNLEDVEVKTKLKRLNKMPRNAITKYFKTNCKRYNISKVQIQYTGEASSLISKIKTNNNTGNYIVKYEITALCKKADDTTISEYLFDDNGQLLNTIKVTLKNSSNLEY